MLPPRNAPAHNVMFDALDASDLVLQWQQPIYTRPTAFDTMTANKRSLTAIVAATLDHGIGREGTLPWRLPGEMKYFARGEFAQTCSRAKCARLGYVVVFQWPYVSGDAWSPAV